LFPAQVSYPRTETEIFKPDADLRGLIEHQRHDPRWGGFAAALVDDAPDSPASFEWPRGGAKDDEAHPPIHPLRAAAPGELAGNEARIYELITRHFLACCARDAKGRQTTVLLDVAGEVFEAKGLVIDRRAFLDVYTWETWHATTLPAFRVGDRLAAADVARFECVEGATRPPTGLTEAELLALMDKHGIGTDATMADHIKTVLTRDYARKDGQTGIFAPQPLGRALVEAYDEMGERLNRPDLRSKMEADVSAVAAGTTSKEALVKAQLATMRRCFDVVAAEAAKLDDAMRQRFGGGGGGHPAPDAAASTTVDDASGFESRCGACGNHMRLRVTTTAGGAKRRYSLRCATCDESFALPDFADSFTNRSEQCLLCGGGRRPSLPPILLVCIELLEEPSH